MLVITPTLTLKLTDIKFSFMASPGPGGQNVNKVASAALLRFNIHDAVALSAPIRARLIILAGKNINRHGELIIKASRYRSQEGNKQDALERLCTLLKRAAAVPKLRRQTCLSFAKKRQRLQDKKSRSKTKFLRSRKNDGGSTE